MTSRISSFYRFWLPTVDPFFALTGVLANHFAQSAVLSSYNPKCAGVTIEAAVGLDTIAGHLLATLLLQVVLLRIRPNDLGVWRCVQAAILIVDIWMIGAMCKALNAQGRLDFGDWRTEELTNIGITGTMGAVRVAFLMNIGIKRETKERKA